MFLLAVLLISLPLIGLLLAQVRMIQGVRAIPGIGPNTYPLRAGEYPKVSVIVPARNEEARIGTCLATLLAQDYPALEIIVVDDCSTDRTSDIVREMAGEDGRVRLIQGRPPAPGWLGKPHAIWQGVAASSGEFLCFVDSDGELHPQCIRQALESMEEHRADLLTLGMRLECPSFWERAIQPLIVQLVLMGFPAEEVNNPDSEVASANGPFLFFRRSAYEAIGGHEAVRNEIVEDLVLARRIKENGLRLSWVLAPELMSVRMYASLREIWDGWSKNFFKSLDEKVSLALLAGLGIFWMYFLPWMFGLCAGYGLLAGPDRVHAFTLLVLSLAVLLTHVVQRKWIASTYGLTDESIYLQPLGALLVMGILANSTIKTRGGGGIRWKGRTYAGGQADGGEESPETKGDAAC